MKYLCASFLKSSSVWPGFRTICVDKMLHIIHLITWLFKLLQKKLRSFTVFFCFFSPLRVDSEISPNFLYMMKYATTMVYQYGSDLRLALLESGPAPTRYQTLPKAVVYKSCHLVGNPTSPSFSAAGVMRNLRMKDQRCCLWCFIIQVRSSTKLIWDLVGLAQKTITLGTDFTRLM